MAAQRALENWNKARDLLKSKFRQDRLQACKTFIVVFSDKLMFTVKLI